MKSDVSGLIIFLFLVMLIPVFLWLYLGFYYRIPADLAETIFSNLIQVNATLIGFVGLILVYNLRKTNELKNMYMRFFYQTREKIQSLENEPQQTIDSKNNSRLPYEKDILLKNYEHYNGGIKYYEKEKSKFGSLSFSMLTGFLLSITFSIIGIIKITEMGGVQIFWLIFSLMPLFIGISILLLSLYETSIYTNQPSNEQNNDKSTSE